LKQEAIKSQEKAFEAQSHTQIDFFSDFVTVEDFNIVKVTDQKKDPKEQEVDWAKFDNWNSQHHAFVEPKKTDTIQSKQEPINFGWATFDEDPFKFMSVRAKNPDFEKIYEDLKLKDEEASVAKYGGVMIDIHAVQKFVEEVTKESIEFLKPTYS